MEPAATGQKTTARTARRPEATALGLSYPLLVNRQRKVRFRRREIRDFLERLQDELSPGSELDLCLVSDAAMRRYNQRYRNHNSSTDVLSFSPHDLLISAEAARRQARRLGHSVEAELKILALHGALHLAGYEHEGRRDRLQMLRAERRWRQRFGLPPSLTERS